MNKPKNLDRNKKKVKKEKKVNRVEKKEDQEKNTDSLEVLDNRVQVIYEEGIRLYKEKKFNIAASIFVKLAETQKHSSSINFFAGICLFMMNHLKTAESFFKTVVLLKKNYQQTMKSCIFLGYIYIQYKYYEEAFDVLKLPVESKYHDPYGYSLMGYLVHQNQKYEEADIYFKKCLEIDPENPLFNNNYGYNLLIWKENFEECIPYLEKAVRKKKNNPAYLHSLGWALFFKERYPESEKILNLSLKLNKNRSALVNKHLEMVKKKSKARK